MPSPDEPRDLLPDTPTAHLLRESRAAAGAAVLAHLHPDGSLGVTADDFAAAAPGCAPQKFIKVPPPEAPDAPICQPKKFIKVPPPEDPDAPVCQPKKFIKLPAPESASTDAPQGTLPEWSRAFGESLATRFR